MLILSTFNSDYLQNPALEYPHTPLLQSLLEKFTSESINIKYVNKNLIGELINLNSDLGESKSCAILFRLFDFIETNSTINETKLNEHLDLVLKQITTFKQESALPFLVFLCPSPESSFINNKFKKIEKEFLAKLRKNKIHTLSILDIPKKFKIIEFENPLEEDTHIPYTPKFYTVMAYLLARKLHAISQKPYKAIAVDCDNTLWTGAAVDDGAESIVFEEHNIFLQKYLKEQHEKGILIFLCSRNLREQTILDVFKNRRAEMPLKLNNITGYRINDTEKSINIKELAEVYNIFPDSFRFIDDNPLEIHEVSQIPGLLCITMPQDIRELKDHWAFDIDEYLVVTETDKNRAELYKQAEVKEALATKFHDPVEYLRSPELGQTIVIRKMDSKDVKPIQRVSQLSGKTNQFNLFPESKIKEINEIYSTVNSDEKAIFIGTIKDNFSAEDIVAVAITSSDRNSLTINSFFVSCRAFRRGMEYEMLEHIAQFSRERGLKNIKLKFKKSEKNNSASSFLNILSRETNKDPISRFLMNKSNNYAWIHEGLKFLLKKLNICLDYDSLESNDESSLTLSSRKLIDLELDSLIRSSLNVSQGSSKLQNKKATLNSNEINEKYLIELKQITASLDYLFSKFFIDNNVIKSILDLENRVNKICTNLLGEEGYNKSLVARGLDSLKATELRYYLYESDGVNITIPKLLCQKTTVTSLIEYIKGEKISPEPEIVVQNDNFYNQILPVSFQQQRIWFAEQKESANNSANYHMIACYKASKNLDIPRFQKACHELIKLYDVFGTTFFMEGSALKQLILEPEKRQLNFQVKNLKPETSLEEAIQLEISQPWTMESKASLIRFTIFKDIENYHILIHVHHGIFDAPSFENIFGTLAKKYQSELTDYPPQYYSGFICDQQKKLEDEVYQMAAFEFLQKEFSKIETITVLPHDQALSIFKPTTELAAKRYSFTLSFPDMLALKILAQSTGVTCFSAVSALFSLLICSYTHQEHITLVTATNGRGGHPLFDKMVGFFVNLLVHQFDLEKNEHFTDYLKKINKKILASQEFQDIPFNKVQEILHAGGVKDILSSPAFIYQSYTIPELRLDNEIAELEIPKQPIIFDLRETCRFGNFTLFAQEKDQMLNFVIEYAEDLFSTDFIKGFAKNFLHTILNVCNNPDRKLQDISVICYEERKKLLNLGQGPTLNYAENDNLIQKFQLNAQNYPDYKALCYGEIRLSYKEVDQQATNLAHALIEAGVDQGNYVGIFLDADHLFFIAELALLKIGAVFIPLSKENPNERLKLIINDANIKFFIVDDDTKDLFDTDFQTCQLISINSIKSTYFNKTLPLLVKTIEDRFCVLYTSGSTGKPKGVILQEKGIYRVVESPRFVKVLPGDKIAQTANQAFDAAQLECWLAWNHGACLVIFDKTTILNTSSLQRKLNAENITHMWLTARVFDFHTKKQPDLFKNLKYLMVGGDVVYKDTISKVLNVEKYPVIVNGYGPTETSIFALTYTFDKQTLSNFNSSPVGLPINETTVEILTPFGTLTPLGGIGMLSVKGQGVGSYLNLPKVESLRFTGTEKRSYLTGDLVKYTTKDPQIMFVGRENEQQVKIRGNLVSVEEVRACLLKYKGINQVEVLIKKIDEENQLVAFYNVDAQNDKVIRPTDQNLYDHLSKSLAPYMIPKFYIEIGAFTTNANGKLNRTQFQVLEAQLNTNSLEEIPPQTPNAIEIFNIVKKRLKRFPNNIKANFNSFGCDSIAMIEIINAINAKFKPEFLKKFKPEFEKKVKNKFKEDFEKYLSYKIFNANDLFQNPTVEGLENLLIKKLNDDANTKSLRMLKEGDSNLPAIVFIHPAGGGLSCFDKLRGQITFQNPCYGIEDPLLASNQSELLSMEEMANNYYYEIIKDLNIPIVLVGFSFGGLLACKIAALFEAKENNALLEVLLFDTWVVSCASQATKNNLIKNVLLHCAKQREKANVDTVSSEVMRELKELCEHHQSIGFECKAPKLYSTPVSLFKATNLELETDFNDMNKDEKNLKQSNYLLNFLDEKLFRKFEIPATHYDLLEAPDKNNLTEIFSKCINEINQKILLPYKLINSNRSVFFPLLQTIENAHRLPDLLHMQLKH